MHPLLVTACQKLTKALDDCPPEGAMADALLAYERNLRYRFEYMRTFVEKIEKIRKDEARKAKCEKDSPRN